MLKIRLAHHAAWAALLTAAVSAGPAWGAAFQLREGDPDWLANAFAGSAAKAYDAGTVWNNPAGMTRLDANEIDQGINYFDPGIRFSGADYVGNVPVHGSNGGDGAPQAVTAGLESVWNFSPDLKFGVALEAPFAVVGGGMAATSPYPNCAVIRDFKGRYTSVCGP